MEIMAEAPATIANVAVGFDILGFAFPVLKDRVWISKTDGDIELREIVGSRLPSDPSKNTATVPLIRMKEELGLAFGFSVKLEKGIPLSSGLGGSAASAVAAVLAANELLDEPLTRRELFRYALAGEAIASGGVHGDNVAPALYGGLTMCLESTNGFDIISLPVPELHCVVIHPPQQIQTRNARKILSPTVPLSLYVRQSMRLAAFLHAVHTNDFALLRRFFEDLVIEPQRSSLIPQFSSLKSLAINCGAIGFSIAGAGPSMFSWLETEEDAHEFQEQVNNRFPECYVWASPLK